MKFSIARPELIWSVLVLPSLARADYNSRSSLPIITSDIIAFSTDAGTDGPNGSCLGGTDFFASFQAKCNYDSLAAEIATLLPADCNNTATEEINLLLNSDEATARDTVYQVCQDAFNAYTAAKGFPWADVSTYGAEWDKEYYDGNTYWNEEIETEYDTIVEDEEANHLKTDANRVKDLYNEEAERYAFEYPGHIDNFESCDLRSIMCCWASDRQANDNNGNCATPYDYNCQDSDPGDNTDLCAVDMARSGSSSSHVADGIAFFENNEEGPIHCHGLAWANDPFDHTDRYKANNLFYVSMYDHMHQRGYVRNVPGAPMCGCVEKMPIVSRSDCTQIDVDESWTFQWNSASALFTGRLEEANIDFNACQGANRRNNDLEAYYQRLVNENKASDAEFELFKNTVVGNNNCPSAIRSVLYDKGYAFDPEPTLEGWTQVYAKGALIPVEHELLKPGSPYVKQGNVGDLRHLQANDSPVFYVKRWCSSCVKSHREIIYKRLTAIPEEMNFYDLFTNNWRSYPNNTNLVDFTLHSSMEDALEDRLPWTFCNYDDNGIGFPRDCGPTGKVNHQWNSVNRGGQPDVAFYVWNENPNVDEPERTYTTVGETGRTTLETTIDEGFFTTITFRNQYINPVVVAFINTRGGSESVQVRVRNLTPSGFELFMQEPDNEAHSAEEVSYIVMESGRQFLLGNIFVEAGITSTTIIHRGGEEFSGHPVEFEERFGGDAPAVLHSLVTHNNNDFMASLVTDVSSHDFQVAMEAAETNKDSPGEDVAWIAFSSATGTAGTASFSIGTVKDGSNDGVDDSPQTISYSGANFAAKPDIVVSLYGEDGTDGSWARGQGTWTATTLKVFAEEDQISDSERNHADERFAYAAFDANTDIQGVA